MKAMVLGKAVFLAALLFCIVASGSDQPSEEEFKLFCRILEETNDMLLEPDYVYDEDKDRNILREMQVLFNATTDNMDEFRKTLWVTKDFFEAHPPPTDAGNRKRAHSEIGNLIDKGEKEIQDSRKIAEAVNNKIKEAKLSVAQGLYGPNVTVVPKIGENWTSIQSDADSIFNSKESAAQSCGNESTGAGKTLFNDFFCVCVGEEDLGGHAPCSAAFVSPESGNNNCCKKECCKSKPCYGDDYCRTENCCAKKDCCKCCGSWTQLRHEKWQNPPLSVAESIEKIMDECDKNKEDNLMKKGILGLLKEYVEMIGKGDENVKNNNNIFGHSGRTKKDHKGEVKECDGKRGSTGDKHRNEKLCVNYKNNFKDGQYEITWHNKFKEASEKLQDAKKTEDQILKNRAALLLLKSQAWVAYSREKDDETSNLDDMNASDKKDTMAEKKSEARKYIDVPSQSTQGSQPSQLAPGNADGPKYTYISSTESTQEEAPAAPTGGGEPPYIYVSSTGTPSQQTPAPESPSPTQQDPPTQPPKRLREENKTGERDEAE